MTEEISLGSILAVQVKLAESEVLTGRIVTELPYSCPEPLVSDTVARCPFRASIGSLLHVMLTVKSVLTALWTRTEHERTSAVPWVTAPLYTPTYHHLLTHWELGLWIKVYTCKRDVQDCHQRHSVPIYSNLTPSPCPMLCIEQL